MIILLCYGYIQSSWSYNIDQYNCNNHEIFKTYINFNYNLDNQHKIIYIESDYVNMYDSKTIELSGNVLIKQDNNIIKSNKLIIYQNYDSNHISNTLLYANGDVTYDTNNINLTGSRAIFNLNNKNVDLYQGTYYIPKFYIYGSADSIIQRKNHRYTIVKKGKFTLCINHHNSWNIKGSKIVYDYFDNTVYIWNAYLSIKKIPLFYSPYLLLLMNNNNTLGSYIPYIKYSKTYGCICKIPFPLVFSKYYSGNIAIYYIDNIGIGLNTKIHYKLISGTGTLISDIMEHNMKNHNYNHKKYYNLHWKHHGFFNKKWHLNIDYMFQNDYQHNDFNAFNNKYFKTINDTINQKILCYYNNDNFKISLIYLNNSNKYKQHILKNDFSYAAVPQLEMFSFYNFMQKNNPINCYIFSQFSKFVPSCDIYPNAIRIHIEPVINFIINNHWIRCNAETKLNMTHYHQYNIDNYNKHQDNHKYCLKNEVNRIIPKFKINGKISFHKKTNMTQRLKYFLESQLQYVYIPYVFQENIGIYDTKIVHIDHNNLFHNMQYSGLDRITNMNQITGSIMIRCVNKNDDKFYLSLGQIYNLDNNNNVINDYYFKNYSYISTFNPKSKLRSLGIGRWNINNNWSVFSELQYDTTIKKLSFGNTAIEYVDKKNTIFQTNYRYINIKYLQKIFKYPHHLINYQTISQLGFITHYPFKNHWIFSSAYYLNIKSNFVIDQIVGIKYFTTCWVFSVSFERNIINRHHIIQNSFYDNQIRFHFNLLNLQSDTKSGIDKFLDSKIIPYQNISNNT